MTPLFFKTQTLIFPSLGTAVIIRQSTAFPDHRNWRLSLVFHCDPRFSLEIDSTELAFLSNLTRSVGKRVKALVLENEEQTVSFININDSMPVPVIMIRLFWSSIVRVLDSVFVGTSTIGQISEDCRGGALSLTKSQLAVQGSVFKDCHAPAGGAIGSIASGVFLKECNFSDRAAHFEGGALLCNRLLRLHTFLKVLLC
jgi:hypothetical protein